MTELGWLTRWSAEVPASDDWLSEGERAVLAGLGVEKRRRDWRLGRFTAKAAVAEWLGVSPSRVEIVAARDGAPEASVDGTRAPVSVSLSHRGERALAVVVDAPAAVGCDLELVEARSPAFISEWLAPAEQLAVSALDGVERAQLANLIWTAKEAGAKVLREGLRLNVRRAVVTISEEPEAWAPVSVDWGRRTTAGWWHVEESWVMSVACDPAPQSPRWIGS